jgi:hypothetical protein
MSGLLSCSLFSLPLYNNSSVFSVSSLQVKLSTMVFPLVGYFLITDGYRPHKHWWQHCYPGGDKSVDIFFDGALSA